MATRGSAGPWAVIAATAVLAAVGWRSLATVPGGPGHAMVTQGVVLIGPAVLILVALALGAERLWPAVARPFGAVGHRQDAAYLALYVAVAVPAVTLIGAGAATVVQRLDGGFTLHPFAGLPRWALVVGRARAHRPGQLDLAPVQPPGRRVLALPRAAPLAGGDEHPHVLPCPSVGAHELPAHGGAAHCVGDGGAVPATVLVGYVVLSTLPHANVRLGLRSAALRRGESGLPPAAPRPGWPAWGEPRDRARDLGRAGRAGRLPGPGKGVVAACAGVGRRASGDGAGRPTVARWSRSLRWAAPAWHGPWADSCWSPIHGVRPAVSSGPPPQGIATPEPSRERKPMSEPSWQEPSW